MTDESGIATPLIDDRRNAGPSRLSWVWLVPLLAVAGALAMAWQSYADRDVPITIIFPDAKGLEIGKTPVKFQDVTVGTVTGITFSDDLKSVRVQVGIQKDMARFVDTDARFWLVTAKISAQEITGLETILSGAHINADWDAKIGNPQDQFIAQSQPPLIRPDAKGTEVILTTPDSGSVSVGAPVLHKGVKMGTIEAVDYDIATDTVQIRAFIDEPYDKVLNTGTRFWNASGVNIALNDEGLDLNVGSLSSILQGGVAFSTSVSGGKPVKNRAIFDLYKTRRAAEDSLLSDNLRSTINLSSPFENSVKGLEVGSDVFYFGLKVGQVQALAALAEDGPDGVPEVRMLASYTLQPTRLGIDDTDSDDPQENLDFIAALVEKKNLRARLMPNSLFSGGVHIELFEAEDATPAVLDLNAEPFPILPSVPTPENTLETAAEGVLDRVAQLPIEELMTQAINLISDVDRLVANKDTQEIPRDLRVLLGNVNSIAGSEGMRALPQELTTAIASVNDILGRLETAGAVNAVLAALENVKTATANMATASDKLPGLVEDIDLFVRNANTWPVDRVVNSADSLLISANDFLNNDSMEQVPDALSGALSEARMALKELREGGAAANLNRTLKSAGTAADSIASAADGLPQLSRRLERLANAAENTVGAYGPTSEFNREVRAAVEDIRDAVKSIDALAQAIRRKPNSLLVGR